MIMTRRQLLAVMGAGTTAAAVNSTVKRQDQPRKGDKTMYFGVQYYPEHWPEDRWSIDVKMMKRAGVNTVRMGEFAWSAMEPEEGKYDFGWMDRALALLNENGIKTIMCTMSRTPPPWVFRKYPGVVNTASNGRVNRSGYRYTIGLSHPEFVEVSQRIDNKVIEHFAGNDAIVGWQIDNEIGSDNDCYCDACQARFRDYLRNKYVTVANLNKCWGENFWSIRYSDFDDVPHPITNPQVALEYRRFMSELNVGFAAWRAERIRKLDPGKWITTNFQAFKREHTDYNQLARTVDICGINHYPAITPEITVDYYRGAGRKAMVVEECTSLGDVDVGDGWMRLWAYMAIAHGSCGMIFFRWRYCRWGKEQFSHGILSHGGQENRQYRELVKMGKEIAQVGSLINATQPESQVAIVSGYDSRWAFSTSRLDRRFDGVSDAVRFHKALTKRNITTDAMDPREDLTPYKMVIAPRLFLVDEPTVSNLGAFVEAGGILCLSAASGVVDEYGKCFAVPRPGPLAPIAGVEVTHVAPLERPVPLATSAVPELDGAQCMIMGDEIQPTSARVLCRFAAGWRKGMPAITENDFGKGKVIYVGTVLQGEAIDALAGYLCGLAGIKGIMKTPQGVSAYERQGPDHRLLFVLNYTDTRQTVTLPHTWKDAFSGQECREIQIDPIDLRLLMAPNYE